MSDLPQHHRPEAMRDKSTGGGRLSADDVYNQLRAAILALELQPGTVINRAELQARFELSSTPVRDALTRLAAEGLVDVIPQSVTRVSYINIAKAREAQFMRRALEMEAAATIAASPDKAVVPVLEALIDEQRKAAAKDDFLAFDHHDGTFHRRLFEASGVADLFELTRLRSGHIDRIRRLNLPVAGKMQSVIQDHEQILAAIVRNDEAGARRATRDHLSRSLAYTPALRERFPHFFQPEI